MTSVASLLPAVERQRVQALPSGDTATAGPLHAEDYWLVTPNGPEMTKEDYLGAIVSGSLRCQAFEPISEMAVLDRAEVAVLRYKARISFDDGPGFACWHTDCYRLRDATWQVVWSQATAIAAAG